MRLDLTQLTKHILGIAAVHYLAVVAHLIIKSTENVKEKHPKISL